MLWIADMQAWKEQGLLLAVRREEGMRCMQAARRQETRRHVPDLSEWREENEEGKASLSWAETLEKAELNTLQSRHAKATIFCKFC